MEIDNTIILNVIDAINKSFPIIMNKYFPNYHHKDPYNYFLTGSCAKYAEILHEVFNGYAKYVTNNYHALVQIGKFCYDVKGLNYDASVNKNLYIVYEDGEENEFLLHAEINFGRHDEHIIDTIMPELIAVGKEALAKQLNENKPPHL